MASVKKILLCILLTGCHLPVFCWGFFAHKKINYYAVFLLPPQMMVLYKPNIDFLSEHAVDPDKRRYLMAEEGPRHYIDMDHYGSYPYKDLPRNWSDAVARYGADSLAAHGIAPWWLQQMMYRLTTAFREKSKSKILKASAEIGHYLADLHVPLHATSNYNGQHTGQEGIHGFWESRIPEMLADTEWDFLIGKSAYIHNQQEFIWNRLLQSAAAADTVLGVEQKLTLAFPPDRKFAFEERNGKLVRQYSAAFSRAYNEQLQGMIERRMRQSVYAVASMWYTAWADAGQPDLSALSADSFSEEDRKEFEALDQAWHSNRIKNREHEVP